MVFLLPCVLHPTEKDRLAFSLLLLNLTQHIQSFFPHATEAKGNATEGDARLGKCLNEPAVVTFRQTNCFFYCQVNQVATACKTKYWCYLVYLVALWRAKRRHGVSLPSGNSALCDSSLSFNATAPRSTRSNA